MGQLDPSTFSNCAHAEDVVCMGKQRGTHLVVVVLGVSVASVFTQESLVHVSAPKAQFSDISLIRFGKHQVQSLVDSGQGLPSVEAGSLGHFKL